MEARHLLGEQLRVADLEAVRAEDDDRAAGEAAVAVLVEEALERLADAGPAVPVDDLGGCASQRRVGVGALELARDARQRVPKQKASQRLSERSAACANMTSARE